MAVVAVDVGNSKTDLAVVGARGEVLAAVRGPTSSHQQVGEERCFETLASLAAAAFAIAGVGPGSGPAGIVAYSAAGADTPKDIAMLRRGVAGLGLATETLVVNDCRSGLRAGTDRGWGVCVICGSGINCLGLGPDGRAARFDALGEMSGDWGGGGALGEAALAAAVRAQDGRGPSTALAPSVPAHFGLARPRALTLAFYEGRIPWRRRLELAPLVFATAMAGDEVARGIVDRLADEIVAWATAAIRRAHLGRLDPDVVLAGGVFRAEDPEFYSRIEAGVRSVAPASRLARLTAPPVVGSALLGLDRLDGMSTPADVEARLRAGLTHAAFETR
ncbi:MAG TPA: BadF/BadG/BcrA/BcrD ATPase family protein [Candidatus Dormibacteraeota bacterium]|nr:BadF/BadG/BcrA/BcrD ATPase family protein [Candidatus Dormibacteraeota bacterium]